MMAKNQIPKPIHQQRLKWYLNPSSYFAILYHIINTSHWLTYLIISPYLQSANHHLYSFIDYIHLYPHHFWWWKSHINLNIPYIHMFWWWKPSQIPNKSTFLFDGYIPKSPQTKLTKTHHPWQPWRHRHLALRQGPCFVAANHRGRTQSLHCRQLSSRKAVKKLGGRWFDSWDNSWDNNGILWWCDGI